MHKLRLEPDMVVVSLSSMEDCHALLLVLSYLSQSSYPHMLPLLVGGSVPLQVLARPVLCKAGVDWIPAGSGVRLEFIGMFRYSLRSPRKEIHSLEAAYFYLK